MDCGGWDFLLTWISQVNPMQQKNEVVDQFVGNYTIDKVNPPLQDQRYIYVDCKTNQIVDSQEHFDP